MSDLNTLRCTASEIICRMRDDPDKEKKLAQLKLLKEFLDSNIEALEKGGEPMDSNQVKLKILITAYGEEAPDFQASLRDMLTDLRHVAAELRLDFEFALEGSLEVYGIEADEAQEDEDG